MSSETPRTATAPYPSVRAIASDAPGDERDSATIPLMEEEVHVAKREVVTGRIRVRTMVETLDAVVREELDREHVTVSRVPVDRYVDVAPTPRTEGELTIIPVLEEVLVLEKRLLLKEEIHIRRTSSKEAVEQLIPLRKQHAVIEEAGADVAREVAERG